MSEVEEWIQVVNEGGFSLAQLLHCLDREGMPPEDQIKVLTASSGSLRAENVLNHAAGDNAPENTL